MGLGEPTGVELAEDVGQRANKEVKKSLYIGFDSGWFTADQILAAIGQSINRFTPMQLCVYATTLANRGVRREATFMNRVVSADYQELLAENTPKVLVNMNLDPIITDAIFAGMQDVLYSPNGTAFDPQWQSVPARVAGKTGTAEQFIGASDHGSFVCFAPVEDPQIAIAIYIEKGGHGSTLASIARAILREYFNVGTVSDVTVYENRLS